MLLPTKHSSRGPGRLVCCWVVLSKIRATENLMVLDGLAPNTCRSLSRCRMVSFGRFLELSLAVYVFSSTLSSTQISGWFYRKYRTPSRLGVRSLNEVPSSKISEWTRLAGSPRYPITAGSCFLSWNLPEGTNCEKPASARVLLPRIIQSQVRYPEGCTCLPICCASGIRFYLTGGMEFLFSAYEGLYQG